MNVAANMLLFQVATNSAYHSQKRYANVAFSGVETTPPDPNQDWNRLKVWAGATLVVLAGIMIYALAK